MRDANPQPGEVVAGRYRIHSVLGRGRGILYLAEHTGIEQRVALRLVSPSLADAREIERFRREARALARLSSEHVARILDVGTLPDGSLYLARQYLEGVNLAAHVAKRGALPVVEAVDWILQATEAVAEAHAYGILHRELSPDRMFLAERSPGVRGGPPMLKVIDFGTAKLLTEPASSEQDMTATNILGVSPYSSPEMLKRQRDIDVRTDVWSLGAILYEMLCGRPPFGRDQISLGLAILRDEPADLGGLNPDVSEQLEEAIHRALAKDRGQRPADTHAFAASLVRFGPRDAHARMERIHDLAVSAHSLTGTYAPDGDEDAMEISQVEELEISHYEVIEDDESLSDDSTGDSHEEEETRVARPDMAAGVMRSMMGGSPPGLGRAEPVGVATLGGLGPKAPNLPPPAPLPAPAAAESEPTRARPSAAPISLRLPPPPQESRQPRVMNHEKTEALGVNFFPSDPMGYKRPPETTQSLPAHLSVPQMVSHITGTEPPPPVAPLPPPPMSRAPAMTGPPSAGRIREPLIRQSSMTGPPSARAMQRSMAMTGPPAPAQPLSNEHTGLRPFLPPRDLAMHQGPVSVPDPVSAGGPPSDPSPISMGPRPSQYRPSSPPPHMIRDEATNEPSFGRKVALYAIGFGLMAIILLVIALVVLMLR